MAGIYIPGMEMPKSSGKYRIEFDSCGNPYLLSDSGDLGLWHLVPVPDHGRLVDVDEVCNRLLTLWDTADKEKKVLISAVLADVVTPIIVGTPTIIPASEEGE